MTQHSGLSTKLASYGICLVIALAPLPLGSAERGSIAVWVLFLAVISLLENRGDGSPKHFGFIATLSLVAACWALVIALQLTPDSPLASNLINPIWATTGKLLGTHLQGYITIARDQPYLSAGAQIACALAILCGFCVGKRRDGAQMLLNTFAWSGALYAVYGIGSFLIDPGHTLWLEKLGYQNRLTATFIGANTAAVYFGACSTAWLMLLAESIDQRFGRPPRNWREVADGLFLHPSRRTIYCIVLFFVVLSSTLMTGSRLGAALTLLALCGAGATYYRRLLNTWWGVIIAGAFMCTTAVILLQVLGGRVNERADITGLSDEGRFQAYAAALRIIRDYPWLGTGLGTFRWAFPEYRGSDLSPIGIWDRAHSTTLELAAEMGIPFTLIVVVAWLAILIILASGMIRRKRDNIFPILAFWASLLAVLHTQMDFSLQIPGLAIVIFALAGMGLAQSVSSQSWEIGNASGRKKARVDGHSVTMRGRPQAR